MRSMSVSPIKELASSISFCFIILQARRRKDSDDEGIKHGQQHNLSWADTEGFNANQFRNHDHEHDTDMQFDVLHGSPPR